MNILQGRWILSSRKYYDPKSVITKKAEEQNLKKDSWIPTVGHQASFKKLEGNEFAILYLGGNQGSRVSSFASYLFCQKVGYDANEIWLQDIRFKNQIRSHHTEYQSVWLAQSFLR